MKHANHTPGPWAIVYANHDGTKIRVRDEKALKGYLGKFEGELIGEDGPENWKNARLIAAAPELFEALRFLTDCFKGQTSKLGMAQQAGLMKAFEAIAKARGEA